MRKPWRDYCICFEGSGRHRYADIRMRLHRALGAAAWLCYRLLGLNIVQHDGLGVLYFDGLGILRDEARLKST